MLIPEKAEERALNGCGVFVSKGFALVGVELTGNAATLDGLLKRMVEGITVGG